MSQALGASAGTKLLWPSVFSSIKLEVLKLGSVEFGGGEVGPMALRGEASARTALLLSAVCTGTL